MTKSGKRCGICKYASWELTKSGQINRNQAGCCHYEVVLPLLPASVIHAIESRSGDGNLYIPRYAIHPTDGDDCPVYELRQGPPLSGTEYRQQNST